MNKTTPFQLSRIYAGGWNAGRNCDAVDPAEVDLAAEHLNPHQSFEERKRWSQGFADAVLRDVGASKTIRPQPTPTGD